MFTIMMLWYVGPAVLGALMLWFSGKCKGKNARDFFRLSAWGFLLLYLRFLPILAFGFLNLIVTLAPSVICFFLAINAIIKEMRAQKNGEFTEAA